MSPKLLGFQGSPAILRFLFLDSHEIPSSLFTILAWVGLSLCSLQLVILINISMEIWLGELGILNREGHTELRFVVWQTQLGRWEGRQRDDILEELNMCAKVQRAE